MMKKFSNKNKNNDNNKRWWIFKRLSRVKPTREITKIEHNVDFNRHYEDDDPESYEINKYLDEDNNHYR